MTMTRYELIQKLNTVINEIDRAQTIAEQVKNETRLKSELHGSIKLMRNVLLELRELKNTL